MRQTDIAIVGGGLAGSLTAAMLGRAGIDAVLIDPHVVYPPDFRCEKLDGGQFQTLRKTGLAHKSRDGVRLLAKGEITAKIDIEVAGASASARQAVEKAGGGVTTTFTKKVYSNKKGEPGKRQKRRADSAAKRAARKA